MPQPYEWIADWIKRERQVRDYRTRFEDALPEFWNALFPAIQETVKMYNTQADGVLPTVDAIEQPGGGVIFKYRDGGEQIGQITADPKTGSLVCQCLVGTGQVPLEFDHDQKLVAFKTETEQMKARGLSTVLLRPILFHRLFSDPLAERICKKIPPLFGK
jgi:hypothetical protein